MSGRVVISSLRVRVPGANPAGAARLGEAVATQVAAELRERPAPRATSAVRLRVEGAPDSARIAGAIVRSLR